MLFPGQQLPLKFDAEQRRGVLSRALSAPPPARRLMLVLCFRTVAPPTARSDARAVLYGGRAVGTTAEVRSVGAPGDDGGVAVVALGRQRGEVLLPPDGGGGAAGAGGVRGVPFARTVRARILSEGPATPLPREFAAHRAAWGPSDARPFDVRALARDVAAALARVLPPGVAAAATAAASPSGSPLQLAYWAAANLPLEPPLRAALLEAEHAAARLRLLAALLGRACVVACAACGAPLAALRDALRTDGGGGGGADGSSDGGGAAAAAVGGVHVNAHGFVHDFATFGRVAPGSVLLQGRPTAEFSWFEGFAWTICRCARCGEHVGWMFSRTAAAASSSAAPPRAAGAGGGGGGGGEGRGRRGDPAATAAAADEAAAGPAARAQRRGGTFWGLRRAALALTDGAGFRVALAAPQRGGGGGSSSGDSGSGSEDEGDSGDEDDGG